jgi:hypothetical protein
MRTDSLEVRVTAIWSADPDRRSFQQSGEENDSFDVSWAARRFSASGLRGSVLSLLREPQEVDMRMSLAAAAVLAATTQVTPVSGQHATHIDGDDITIRGCVTAASAQLRMPFDTLMWSRSGILTAGAGVADTSANRRMEELASRVLFWMDEDDLSEHVGRMVEIRGELDELATGEIEIERDGDFTEVRLELGGKDERIRVPTSWLDGPATATRDLDRDEDREIEIATRKVDVKDVKVLGSCPMR